MTPTEYIQSVHRTLRPDGQVKLNCLLGMIGEAGEVTELFKKALFHGKPVDPEKALLELGDLLFYATALESVADLRHAERVLGQLWTRPRRYVATDEAAAHICLNLAFQASLSDARLVIENVEKLALNRFGVTLREVAAMNSEKLSKRYPHGFVDGGGIRENACVSL